MGNFILLKTKTPRSSNFANLLKVNKKIRIFVKLTLKKITMANKRYFAKQDIINGVLPNTNGQPNILFKKDDKIIGTQTEKFIFNQNMKGIVAKPTVATARVETPDGKTFVPFSQIRIDVDLSQQGSATTAQNIEQKSTTETKNFFTPKNIIIGVLTIAAILGLLKWQKVI